MFKRILLCSTMGLLIALWCCPLGAEQKPNAGNNTSQSNFWTQVSGSAQGGVKWEIQADQSQKVNEGAAASSGIPISLSVPSGPQDLCNFTAVCLDAAFQTCDNFNFPGGELCGFQDPAKACPPPHCPTYPFKVKAVHVRLSNCDPVNPITVTVTPGIRAAIYPTNPNCPVPGNLICSGPAMQIIIPPNTLCQEYIIPLDPGCCVDTSYFASVNLSFPTHQSQGFSLCHDMTCDPCCSYWDQMVGSFVDLCPTALPGNLAIWTDGAMSCQNNCVPPPPDTGNNHFKTWRVLTQPFPATAFVQDQFFRNGVDLILDSIVFLSNPVRKIVQNDTFAIIKPNDHLNWYRARGTNTLLKVEYVNQFESTTVLIDSTKYLLVPAQKLPHPPPDTALDHYKCYRIKDPKLVNKLVTLRDQFDSTLQRIEQITSFQSKYFCNPCTKNAERIHDTLTHYVAYMFNPQPGPLPTQITIDQFGRHPMQIIQPELLLVPTIKKGVVCDAIPGDANASGTLTLADVISINNYVFSKPGCLPLPLCWLSGKICRGDVNGDCMVTLADVIWLVNFIFAKPCAGPGIPPCCWKPKPCPGSTCCLPNPFCP